MGVLPPQLPLDGGNPLSIIICAIVFLILATLAVVGRFFSRRIRNAKLGADDYFVLLALMSLYAQIVVILMSTIYGGVGYHIYELSQENVLLFYKLIAALLFPAGFSLGFAKISICLLLIRIFTVRSFKLAAWCVTAYNVCWLITAVAIAAGFCQPFASAWDKSIKGGKCGNLTAAYTSITALDILGDVMIIVLPMSWVWKLHISPGSKVGLSIIFALGTLNIIAGILRVVYWDRISFQPPADTTWDATPAYLWSIIEPSLAVIVACGGLLRPVFLSFSPPLKRFFSFASKTCNSLFSGRSNGLKYSRWPTSATERVERSGEEENGRSYPLGPLRPLSVDDGSLGWQRPDRKQFTVPGQSSNDLPNYGGTVVAMGPRVTDDRPSQSRENGELNISPTGNFINLAALQALDRDVPVEPMRWNFGSKKNKDGKTVAAESLDKATGTAGARRQYR